MYHYYYYFLHLFSTKTTKNIYKYKSPVIYQRQNFSINNGINEENNNNNDTNMILKTQSFKENENKKNIKKRNKSKTKNLKSNKNLKRELVILIYHQ